MKEEIIKTILSLTDDEKKEFFKFDKNTNIEKILKKFELFIAINYIRFYKDKQAPFHKEFIRNYIKAYLGEHNFLNIGFRGCAKTTLKKLFDVFVLLNDESKRRFYFKVITKDNKISNQIVVDVYNLILEVQHIYGDVFEKEGKKKREETMSSFTLKDGRKYSGGTVGQTQRGNLQDAYRPDFIWFEDIEDSTTIRSQTQTLTIISKSDEAIQGLSDDGNYVVTANYISEDGVVEWFKQKKSIKTQITPIIDNGIPTWEKYTLEKIEQIKNEAEDWNGDYLCDPTKSDNKFFNIDKINEAIKNAKNFTKEINFVKIWEEYKPNHNYGIGGDTSEGIGEDSNAMTLYDFSTGEVIGTYHNSEIAPDMFGYEMARLGRLYGECLVAPEINNTGHATISALKNANYGNIYKQRDDTSEFSPIRTEKLGWQTNRKTKSTMWFDFKRDFEDGLIKIYDIELLSEMKGYTKSAFNEGTSLVTKHFDLLTSAVIGWQLKNSISRINLDTFDIKFNNYN